MQVHQQWGFKPVLVNKKISFNNPAFTNLPGRVVDFFYIDHFIR